MGILTFDQIKSEIKEYHANRSDISDTRLNIVIDLVQLRIARLNDWDELKYTVSGTTVYTGVAADDKIFDLNTALGAEANPHKFKNIYSFRVITGDGRSRKLVGLPMEEFDRRIPEPEFLSTGVPSFYTWFATRQTGATNPTPTAVELWQIPDQAYDYHLRLQVYPRFLTDGGKVDSDTSDFSSNDDLIIQLCVSILYQSQGREDKALQHFRIYSSMLAEARKANDENYESTIAGVRGLERGGTIGRYWADPFVMGVR